MADYSRPQIEKLTNLTDVIAGASKGPAYLDGVPTNPPTASAAAYDIDE